MLTATVFDGPIREGPKQRNKHAERTQRKELQYVIGQVSRGLNGGKGLWSDQKVER